MDPLCFPCGADGTADAILNVVLFIPLGFLLGPVLGTRGVVLLAGALSGGIELAQIAVPGRFPTLADLVLNVSGAWLGSAAVGRAVLVRRLAGATSALLLLAPLILFRPSVPDQGLVGQWAHSLGDLETWEGRILGASVGDHPIAWGPIPSPDEVAGALEEGETVSVRFEVVPPPDGLAPLLTVVDDAQSFVLLVGIDAPDLVFELNTLGETLGLRAPRSRFPDLMAALRRGSAEVRVELRGEGRCATVDGSSTCVPGPTLADGWQLFMPLDRPGWLPEVLSLAWVFSLGLLFGTSGVRPARALLGAATLAGLAHILAWTSVGVAPTWLVPLLVPLSAWAGSLAGARWGVPEEGGSLRYE